MKKAVMLVAIFVVTCGQAFLVAQRVATITFDKSWWTNTMDAEQRGFIYGWLDCRPLPSASKASVNDYQQSVTKNLSSTQHTTQSVAQAIRRAAETLPARDQRGGEIYSEPHGFLDGEWWGDRPSLDGKGYTEGCLQRLQIPTSSLLVRKIESAMDAHYSSGKHDHDKIANVILPILAKYSSDRSRMNRRYP